MKELLVASCNKGKCAEISRLLSGCVGRLYSMEDFPALPEVIEDGLTFEENACKKALSAAVATGIPTIADDSGLVVAALGGRPGVYSARFAGDGACDEANNRKLLKELNDHATVERSASFVCVVALCFPDGTCRTFHGELKGEILFHPRGTGGFGYDPLFFIPGFGCTMAEMDIDLKNEISHRGLALKKLLDYLSGI
jgi:XTP/dITP diphosphohydrolase